MAVFLGRQFLCYFNLLNNCIGFIFHDFFSEKFESTLSINGLEPNMKSQSAMYIQRGRLTHVYASLKPIIGSDDGLSPIEANAITGSLLIGPWKQCSVKL